ncbi:MAG: hypothetical protein WC480_02150 [Patescibacteria group bacterium]
MAIDYNQNYLVEEILALKADDLKDPDVFERLSNTIMGDPQYESEFSDNLRVKNHLEKLSLELKRDQNNFGLYDKCLALINHLIFLRLPISSKEELMEIARTKMARAISSGVDFVERLQMYFDFHVISREDFYSLSRELLKNIKNNQEEIGRQKISVDGGEIRPTLANWLIDYDNFSDINKPRRTELDRASFINSSANVRSLSVENKKILLKVLEIYDLFKYPANQEGGLIKTVTPQHVLPTTLGALSGLGSVNKVQAQPVKIYSNEEIYRLYQGDPAEQQQIDDRLEQIKSTTQNNSAKIIDQLYLLVSKRSVDARLEGTDVLASLQLLATNNKLVDILKEDHRFYDLFDQYLASQSQTEEANHFHFSPASPAYLQRFLAWVLMDKMKLSEHNAARFGLKLANILKRNGNSNYTNIAYFDMGAGEFRWKR